MKGTDDYEKALLKYKIARKQFDKSLTKEKDDSKNHLIHQIISQSPAIFGAPTLKTKDLSIPQLISRANLYLESRIEHNKIEDLKGFKKLFPTKKRSSPDENKTTDGEDSLDQDSDKENIYESRTAKRRKIGKKMGGLHQDAPAEMLENYRESSTLFDDVPDSEKQQAVASFREDSYKAKMQKLVDEDKIIDATKQKQVSFPSNYVLQKQLLAVSNARSGKNFLPGVKQVFEDSPYMSEEDKKAPLTIHYPNVRSKKGNSQSK